MVLRRSGAACPKVGLPAVNLLPGLSAGTAASLAEVAEGVRQPGGLLIASLHWDGN